ncbi:hypothetical protein JVX93_22370 [Mycolicibacterium boenickei]|nr:hypothetical protein JVX93_22370 [Mycolicibacterium boenickei]
MLCAEIHRFTKSLDVVERTLWAAAIDMYDRPSGAVSGEFGEGVAGTSQRGGVIQVGMWAHHMDVDRRRVPAGVREPIAQSRYGGPELLGVLDGRSARSVRSPRSPPPRPKVYFIGLLRF